MNTKTPEQPKAESAAKDKSGCCQSRTAEKTKAAMPAGHHTETASGDTTSSCGCGGKHSAA